MSDHADFASQSSKQFHDALFMAVFRAVDDAILGVQAEYNIPLMELIDRIEIQYFPIEMKPDGTALSQDIHITLNGALVRELHVEQELK